MGLAGCGDVGDAGANAGDIEDAGVEIAPGLTGEPPVPQQEPQVVVADAATIREAIDAAQGNVTVINFWATWCPPCVAEMPALIAFYESHQDTGLKFISLSGDHQSTLEDNIKPFVAEHGLPFDVFVMEWDDPMDMEAIAETLDLGWDGVFPTTYVLNREGEIVFSKQEEVTRAELDAAVAPLLE